MRQTAERRVVQIAAKFYLRSKEGLVVVSNDIRESVMVWSVGLDDDPAGLLTPSGPSCYLAQELKSSLHGPEVGKVQGEIGENRSYQRHSRYVVPFGDHLRPHENVDLPLFPLANQLLLGTPFARGVPIHPGNPRTGYQPAQILFYLLGAKANSREAQITALRAEVTDRFPGAAVMTENALLF